LGLSATSPELPITLPGDSIQLGIHHKVAKGVNDIIHFDNIGIK
jgi:hypothetical protein